VASLICRLYYFLLHFWVMKNLVLAATLAIAMPVAAIAQSGSHRPASHDRVRYATSPHRPVVSGDLVTVARRQFWRAGAWQDTTQIRYTAYDAAGNNLERITDERVAGAWQVRNRRTQTFNPQNQQLTDTIFGISGSPLFAYRRTYTAAGKPDTITVRIRLGMNWLNASRDIYSYDAAGNPERLLWQGNAGGWYNQSEFLYTTDTRGRITVDEQLDWNDNTTSWEPTSLLENTYTAADSLASATYSEWDDVSGNYEILGRGRNRYNAQGLLDSVYNEPYDNANGTWNLSAVTTYQYDARTNRTEELIQGGTSLAALVNSERRLFSYTITGLPEPVIAPAQLTLAPNPASTNTALRYELLKPSRVSVTLRDVLGRPVAMPLTSTDQAAGEHTLTLPLASLTHGVYTVELMAGADSRRIKLVIP
jgi:Family of unknown function (DUF3836)